MPQHPGEILNSDFLETLNLSQYSLARAIGVPPRRINEIVKGKRAITADTALRLACYFSVSEFYWLELQSQYDAARTKKVIAKDLGKIQPYGGGGT